MWKKLLFNLIIESMTKPRIKQGLISNQFDGDSVTGSDLSFSFSSSDNSINTNTKPTGPLHEQVPPQILRITTKFPTNPPNYPQFPPKLSKLPHNPKNAIWAGTLLWQETLSMLRLPGRFTTGHSPFLLCNVMIVTSVLGETICLIIWNAFWICCSYSCPWSKTVIFAIIRILSCWWSKLWQGLVIPPSFWFLCRTGHAH